MLTGQPRELIVTVAKGENKHTKLGEQERSKSSTSRIIHIKILLYSVQSYRYQ